MQVAASNVPFQKLSCAMLVTSFGGQCRKKTAIFYEVFTETEGSTEGLMKAAACNKPLRVSKILRRECEIQVCTFG